MKHAVALGLLAATLALPAYAADDPILSRLAGDWIGRGTYRQGAEAEPERIYCKISNTLVQDGKALQQKGRCSVASNSGSVDGLISAAGGGSYGGELNSLASDGPAKLSGSGAGDKLMLDTSYVDSLSHQPTTSVTTMTIGADGYRVLSERKDGKTGATWVASDITFTAK